MGRRVISLVLVLCLILGCCVTTYAEDTVSEITDLEAWENALGDYTTTDANAYTPVDAENLISANEQDHAYDSSPDTDEVKVTAEYVEGEVLFARQEGGISFFSTNAEATEASLAALGIYNAEAIYSEERSDVALFGRFNLEPQTVWYKARVDGDVLETVEALNSVGGIVAAEPNYIYTTEAVGEPYAVECEQSWYLNCEPGDNRDQKGFHARRGWKHLWDQNGEDFVPGEGTIVAVIDTGVDYTHQDLASSMWVNMAEFEGVDGVDDDGNGYIDDIYGIDATANPRYDAAGNPMDYNGHGTHVAGIIAMANNGYGGVGIAYGTKIMALKAGQATGTFSAADIAEAIEYAVAKGADVINMSFGGTGRSSLIEQALEDAFSTCVLVAAAGNDGEPTTDAPPEFIKKMDIYPAAYSYVLGVMASDESGKLASFSNWDYYNNANAEYEMTAPGTNIYSTLPGDRYAKWNGTSMAAPCVAAAAAVIRSHYSDKDEYNSRFVMGQLASATESYVTYVDAIGAKHVYAKLDLYDSLTKLPQPNLSVSDVFALDNVGNGDENDGDRIMDAGEVIDLGIAIRNQWGKTGTVTIKADAISVGGVANPYVEFITDEITLSSIGAFSSEDNGFEYDDGYLYSVSNPIRFKLSEDTPNDSQICINLTVTTTNGWDTADKTVYDTETEFVFRVQKGKAVRGHITADTTWDNDHYWIVENSVVIDAGVTLTVEPGTQIQFWSSDYEGAYGGKTMAYINNNGTLNMIGTEEEPIEMFPGAGFERYVVEISGAGSETLQYCVVQNARLGWSGRSTLRTVGTCDHCVLVQNCQIPVIRYLDNSYVIEDNVGVYWSANALEVQSVTNSVVCNYGSYNSNPGYYDYNCVDFSVATAENNLYDNSALRFVYCNEKNSVNLMGCNQYAIIGSAWSVKGSNYATNIAILNPILDTNVDRWFRFRAPASTANASYSVSGNYWGTENDILINKMILDDDDFPGALANIVEDPILTLEDDLSAIYPFVTQIWVTEEGSDTVVDELAPGSTYEVHVTYNRDMDPDVQPAITYGGEAPFTDYVVHGDWVSAREWVGTTKISAVATGGTQIFRAKGGAAADDNWLVCGTDELRFQFDIEAATAKSMVLNATGGINQITLNWAQNDYATLAGYNLYRSTSANGNYTKLNSTMLTGNSYVDTNVSAGTTYYYYFTVVDTDGNEVTESKSNIASAAPLDNVKPVVVHTPVATAKIGSDVSISATVTDNIAIDTATLYYKVAGASAFTSKPLTYSNTTGKWTAVIPGTSVTAAGVEYYLEAVDTTGNKGWSGSSGVPYVITTDSTPTLLIASPSTVNVADKPEKITVYGTNLVKGMTVTFGTVTIDSYTVNEDGTEITFATPDLPVGNYTIRISIGDKSAVLPNAVTYRDVSSYVQINAGTVISGDVLRLPLYVGMTGELTAFHAKVEVPTANFSAAKVELAEGISAQVSSSYSGGVLTISMASANSFNPGAQSPLAYLVLTPKAVSEETSAQVKLISGKLNGAETVSSPVGTAVVIYPNFSLNATVTYYKGNKAVSGVTVTAAGVSAVTGSDGKAALTGIIRADVTILASKEGYSDTVEAYDAVLVLQHCANLLSTPLDASQLIAADVNDDGTVDEVDASLILKKYAGLIDFFPAGSWKFEPSSRTATLSSTATNVTFTAIMVGDVDGSWVNEG